MAPEVDVVILTRDSEPLRPEVAGGLARQRGVRLHFHRVIGSRRPQDVNRWQSIVRARNRGAELGNAPLFMFLDDDVVLDPNCILRLVHQLGHQPSFGALASDYLGETSYDCPSRHVAMGATLFRRCALSSIRFRWQRGRCECQCCCDDLRTNGWQIGYCRTAKARHVPTVGTPRSHAVDLEQPLPSSTPTTSPRILGAFNRAHLALFRRRFLTSLRAAGNHEMVTAVTYGLLGRQRRLLSRTPHLEVLGFPSQSNPAIDRLRDFQTVLMKLHADTPVAYWDAGDVWFQASLRPLWDLVRENPQKLLVAREPFSHPENAAVASWTLSIRDVKAAQAAFALLASRPFFNAGFVAGTAATLLRYLRYAHRVRHSRLLRGTKDWGDQLALNLYCHANPTAYHEVDRGWNYCLCGLKSGIAHRGTDGRVTSADGVPVYVIHGNAGTLNRLLPV